MFHSASIFLAKKYIQSMGNNQPIHILLYFCALATIIATASLTITLAVVDGFEISTQNTFQGIYGDYIVESLQGEFDTEKFEQFIKKKFPEIIMVSPYATQQILVNNIIQDEKPWGTVLKAIDPKKEFQITQLGRTLINTKPFEQFPDNHSVIIGKSLAQALGAQQGDTITLLYPQDVSKNCIAFARKTVRIHALFNTGIDDIDTNLICCSFALFEKLFPHQRATHMTMKFKPQVNSEKTIQQLRSETDLHFFNWQDMYPAIISALKLERYALLMILSIIILLASLLIICSLCALIIHKQTDLMTLHYLGLSHHHITGVFIIIGQSIAWTCSCIGIFIGIVAALSLKYSSIIKLPNVYYTSHLPIELHITTPIFVFLLTIILTLISSCIPYLLIKKTVKSTLGN